MTQAQCDNRYYKKEEVYNKSEVDTNINTVNSNFDNYYTKTEVDTKISSSGSTISPITYNPVFNDSSKNITYEEGKNDN